MQIKKRFEHGYALIVVLAFISAFLIITVGIMSLVNAEINMCRQQIDSTKAFFLAEAGIERAAASIRDKDTIPTTFRISDTGLVGDSAILDYNDIIITSVDLGNDLYEITAETKVGDSTRIIKAHIKYNPSWKGFDYSYFINNWGWFYGRGITANGDVRSNGRFDFRYWPRVEGEVYAGQEIGGGDKIRGKAGTVEDGEYIYQHPNSPVLDMPNLQDLDYYATLAREKNSSIQIGGVVLIEGVYGDDPGESGNIVLIGTPSQPIEIDGPVVITGDVIIRGTITGQGTIYAGRNLYVAGDINYKNAPSSPRPSSDNPTVVDQWVRANEDKDMVGFAASENIILGNYTNSTYYGYYGRDQWYSNYWLFYMGNEDVGEDGIPDTGDPGEGDGIFQSEYEDLDGDGVFDDNYNWSDVQTQTAITNFSNLPQGTKKFGDLATNYINRLDGIFYTNHAFAGRVGYGTKINGSIISKDEAIIYRNTITMNYDERANSRYKYDPNWLIDLNLPVLVNHVTIQGWWEE